MMLESCPQCNHRVWFWQPSFRDPVPLVGCLWHVQCFLELTYQVAEEARLKATAAYDYCGLQEVKQ